MKSPQILAASLLAFTAVAADYSINWWSVNGGGGTSIGGVYSVSGTIGQPDTGVMSGGPFAVVGGFWGVLATIQTPGAPWLSIVRTSNNPVVVSWPGPEAGWKLQMATNLDLTPVVWTLLPAPYPVNGTNLSYIEAVPFGNRFYRLTKP